MTDTIESLRRKINTARELESVVRAMKAMAASSLRQYEQAIDSLDDYYHTVELGLFECLHQISNPGMHASPTPPAGSELSAIVFGSDLGFVGQFNEALSEFVAGELAKLPGRKNLWIVSESLHARFDDAGLKARAVFAVPASVRAISPLISRVLTRFQEISEVEQMTQLLVFHNRPLAGALYSPTLSRLLPARDLTHARSAKRWPSGRFAQVIGAKRSTLGWLLHEYLFVALFRACAESLASEHASRLAAMQRAEKSIQERSQNLKRAFHGLRQQEIDEELFDVIASYEAGAERR